MAYLKWEDLINTLNKIVPDDYLVKSNLKVIVNPQDETVEIESDSNEKTKRT